ncbi:MAG: hypothetical protein JO138_17265 [Acidobacteriaceae bacterium]|nr:hypothetical protein [Acidobacteriaceae bacterium]
MRTGFECDTRTLQAIEPRRKRLAGKFNAPFMDDLAIVIQHADLSPSLRSNPIVISPCSLFRASVPGSFRIT